MFHYKYHQNDKIQIVYADFKIAKIPVGADSPPPPPPILL